MTDTDSAVRLERTIAAPPAEVYRAWLEPELLRRWLGPGDLSAARVEVDARVGGYHRVWYQDENGNDLGGAEGVFVELVPDERIAMRWHFVGADRGTLGEQESLLTVAFRPGSDVGTTVLTLVHDRLDGLRAAHPEVADQVANGWTSVLDKLAAIIGRER